MENPFAKGRRRSSRSPIPSFETSSTELANRPNGCSVRIVRTLKAKRLSTASQHRKQNRGPMNKQGVICERLKKFGYASERRIRLYGEDLHLVSNPVADDIGYSVLALTVRTSNLRSLRIPLSIVSMLERELEQELAELVA